MSTTKVDKISGKGLSTNDYTDAEKAKLASLTTGTNNTTVDTALSTTSTNPVQNKVITAKLNEVNLELATKVDKEYVDNKVKEANVNATNAAKIRTEDMQYMGVAFDSEEMPTLRFRASEDPTSKNIGDTITFTDVAGSGADVTEILKITKGQTIVVENSGMPAAVLLSVGGNDAKIVAKTQTGEVLCVYTCPFGEEFIHIYGTSAKYRIYNSDLWRYLLSGKVADVVNECNILSTHTKLLGIGYKSLMSVNGEYVVNSVFNSVSVGSTLSIKTTTNKGGNMSGIITLEPGQTIAALEKAVIAKYNGSNFTVVAVCDESKFGYNDNKFTYFCNKGNKISVAIWVNRTNDNIKYALYDNAAWELLAEKNIVSKINAKADTTYVNTQLKTKVDKVAGKGLSTNDFSNKYRGVVDEIYKLKLEFADLTGLSYIYRIDDSLSSAQVGDTFRWYEDEDGRGFLANYHLQNGHTIKSIGYPILTYYSPDYFGVIAVPDKTGICSYTYEGALDWDDIYVHINSNPQVGTPHTSIDALINNKADKTYVDKALSQVVLLIPESLSVEAPKRLTWGNKVTNYIKAVLTPSNVVQNIIYIGDNKAVEVGTDGSINVIAKGISRVHVIPTNKTALAKTIQIEVGDPRLRISAKTKLRFTANGSMRLT